MNEPSGPGSHRTPAARGPRPLASLLAVALVAAVAGGAVAAGVTLAVLRSQARTNPQEVNLGSRVTLTEDSATLQVASRAAPAVVSVLADDHGGSFGSGFLVTTDGFVVTAVPVIAGASSLGVLLPGETHRRDARVVDYDCEAGVAVLKVDQVGNLPTLDFADSSGLRAGQSVVALGGPFGFRGALARGVVTGVHGQATLSGAPPQLGSPQYSDVVASDALLDPSASGGPLLNAAGQVVGIDVDTAVAGPAGGFALASNFVQPVVRQVVTGNPAVVASLGVSVTVLSPGQAGIAGLPDGVLVTAVDPGGPGDRAGLRTGDVVTGLDENRVDAAHPLGEVLRAHYRPDQRAAVGFSRAGAGSQVQATLAASHPRCS